MLSWLDRVLDWFGGGIVGLLVSLGYARIREWIRSRQLPDRRGHTTHPWPRRLAYGAAGFLIGAGTVAVADLGGDASAGDDPIEVLVVWEEQELDWFQRVVDRYPDGDVVVRPAGTDIGNDLDERFADEDPPDVAIVAQPRLVEHYAERAEILPIAGEVTEPIPPAWNELVSTSVDGAPERIYGAWVKGSYKSLFWARSDLIDSVQPERWHWTDLTEWVRDNTEGGPADAALSIPAEDCWPLTDWFENQLAANDPELYDQLAAGDMRVWDHEPVRHALNELAALWSGRSGPTSALLGGSDGAADTIWRELIRQVADREAAIAFGPSFLSVRLAGLADRDAVRYFPYPPVSGNPPPVIVGGDAAVVPRQPSGDEQRGEEFVRWLTDQAALRAWSDLDPGHLTPSDVGPFAPDTPQQPDPVDPLRPYLTQLLRDPPGGLRFDLSDQFGAVTEGEPGGMSEILFDFFREVTADPPTRGATDTVIRRLEAEARGRSQLGDDCDD